MNKNNSCNNLLKSSCLPWRSELQEVKVIMKLNFRSYTRVSLTIKRLSMTNHQTSNRSHLRSPCSLRTSTCSSRLKRLTWLIARTSLCLVGIKLRKLTRLMFRTHQKNWKTLKIELGHFLAHESFRQLKALTVMKPHKRVTRCRKFKLRAFLS